MNIYILLIIYIHIFINICCYAQRLEVKSLFLSDIKESNINDLNAAIISTFQEVSDGMLTSTMENFGRRLEMVLRNKGGNFEEKKW